MAGTATLDFILPVHRSGLAGLRTIRGEPIRAAVDATIRLILGVYDAVGDFEATPAETNAVVEVHAVDSKGVVGAELASESVAIATATEHGFRRGSGHAAVTIAGTVFPKDDYAGGGRVRVSIWLDGNMIVADVVNVLDPGATSFVQPPTDLVASAVSSSEIGLTWTDNSSSETGFTIQRSPDGETGWTTVLTPAADATSDSDTGLTASTEYFYRIRSEHADGPSGWSNTDSATTSA